MDTLLITGSNGLLGTKLLEQTLGQYQVAAISQNPCANRYLGDFAFHQIDIRQGQAMGELIAAVRPRAVIHTAAMTNVDGCELHPDEAWAVNAEATAAIASACCEAHARLVLLSTDYVFSGEAGPYRESDAIDPISAYGRSKLAAEQAAVAVCRDYCIARTSVVYGDAPHIRANFVTWLLATLREGKTATVVTDQTGSPTLADDLARMVLGLATHPTAHGVYHTTGREWLSRYDFALRIAACFGLDPGLVQPTETAALKQPAPRPRHSGLLVERVTQELGRPPLSVDEGLDELRRQLAAR